MEKKKKLAMRVLKTLRERGFQSYLVGGCVRDLLLKQQPTDYDIATNAHPDQVKRLFRKTVSVGAAFNTVLVVDGGIYVEVSTYRAEIRGAFSDEPLADVKNRDFTINAVLYDPYTQQYIDYVNGIEDIKDRIIRCASSPDICFSQDPLRILRAIRFSANLGFRIEKNTFDKIKEFAGRIEQVSKERIRDELIFILTGENPYFGFKLMDEVGLLSIILPEIANLRDIPQPKEYHPEGDVFTHTMLMLKELKDADIILALAVLFHDVGKPATYRLLDRIRFYGHDREGVQITERAMRRLRFSNDQIKKVSYCVANHMRLMNADKMRESTLKRIFAAPTFETELELHRIDCVASHKDIRIYNFLKEKFEEFKKRPIIPPPLLNGYEIMKMGFKQGPIIGNIHREMVELQLSGVLKNKAQAKRWVKENWLR